MLKIFLRESNEPIYKSQPSLERFIQEKHCHGKLKHKIYLESP